MEMKGEGTMDNPERSSRRARVRNPTGCNRPNSATNAGLDDLAHLAEGQLTPALLAGTDNRDRREDLYAAAESLAGRPEHADLLRTLIAGLQRRAKDTRQAIEGRERSSLKAAASDPGVMAYVFVLGRLHYQVLDAEVGRLQAWDRSLDEATAHDIVDRAFTRVVLSPASDLTRGTGVIAATVQRELLSHYRREGRHRATSLDGPEHERLGGWLATREPRAEDDLASRQTTAALVSVASGLPGQRGVAIMTLIASDGQSGIAAVARRLHIPVNTAKSLTFAARAEFRRRAEQDPNTHDAMRKFAIKLDPRRRGAGRARNDPRR
jgi:DNA-directed RNA polymerase specialized sigma24 family protein